MDIAHVSGYFSPEFGGPPVSLRNYVIGQFRRGHAVRLYTLEGYRDASPAFALPEGIRCVVRPVEFPERLGASKELRAALQHDQPADVYHLHSIWMRAQYYGAMRARQSRRPYLIEINGALDPLELATKPWRKRLARWWYQDAMLHCADCVHVNSEREAVHVRELGFKKPVAIISAGFNRKEAAALLREARSSPPAWASKFADRRVLLYLARIHPAKGIDDLIVAWAALAPRFSDWDLVIAGPGTAVEVAERRSAAERLRIADRCHWLGMVSDTERAWLYDQADVYVLPSHKENFGNTVQEALGSGTPVLTTKATPWLKLEEWRCGWVCDDNPASLTEKLDAVLRHSTATLREMGARARNIIQDRFSLDRVVSDQIAVYEWLLGGQKPECLYAG